MLSQAEPHLERNDVVQKAKNATEKCDEAQSMVLELAFWCRGEYDSSLQNFPLRCLQFLKRESKQFEASLLVTLTLETSAENMQIDKRLGNTQCIDKMLENVVMKSTCLCTEDVLILKFGYSQNLSLPKIPVMEQFYHRPLSM